MFISLGLLMSSQPLIPEDELRRSIYKTSLTPIKNIYNVVGVPTPDGSVGLSDNQLDIIMAAIKKRDQQEELEWWVTTGLKQNGKKLLGPFVTCDLALSVRTYMEMAGAPATYWVEPVSSNPSRSQKGK